MNIKEFAQYVAETVQDLAETNETDFTEDEDTENYNEEEKNVIAQANAITIDWWQSMLSWAISAT